jgi:hypothetical protein
MNILHFGNYAGFINDQVKGQLSGSGRAVTTISRFAKTTKTVARKYPMCVHLRLKEYLKITETRNKEVNSKNLTKIADSNRESRKYDNR